MYFSEKPRLAEVTVRYEALRCDIMQQYYMNKDYDNVIRIATSLDIQWLERRILLVPDTGAEGKWKTKNEEWRISEEL